MAIHRITSITVGVPDVTQAAAWYREFGLAEAAVGRFSSRDGGEQLVLEQAPYRGLLKFGVGVDDPDDLNRIESQINLLDIGARVSRQGDILRVDDPIDKIPIEISVAPRYEPSTPNDVFFNSRARVARTDVPADGVLRADRVRPSNLSHVVRGSHDFEASIRFFTEGIGFEISDTVPGVATFMRCSEMHHNLALLDVPAPFLHHVAFEVDDLDDVGRGASHMIELDQDTHVWGLGRHAIGSNFFWYLRDPAGNFVEYAADEDRITSQDAYQPKQWEGNEMMYSWGQPPPDEFVAPTDIEDLLAAMAQS